jgi:thioesterase domain-containing protein/acyl carrier protein
MYGPTETTIWSTLARVTKPGERITIGHPIDATDVYVMNRALDLQPIGAVGELCIGGDGVARGYRERPELTADRFRADPVRGGHARLYRTGDLARFRDDGQLECLGRIDHQIKIRGLRIELGEIESCLRRVPGAGEVVVVAPPGPTGEPRLVAFWTGSLTDHAALGARARAALPGYMQPQAYVHLDELPLTPHGKVDRKRLVPPDAVPIHERAPAKPAATATQRRLVDIWEALLNQSPIGVDQSFFDLGGDSLLVVVMASRIRTELGVEIALSRILDQPTIERLSASIDAERAGVTLGSDESPLVELKSGGSRCMFLVHDGDGETLLYRNLALLMPDDVAVYGLAPRARRGMHLPYATIEEIAAHYVAELRRRQPEGPYYVAGLCAGGVIAYEVARQIERDGDGVALLALLDAGDPSSPLRHGVESKQRLRRVRELVAADVGQARPGLALAVELARRTRNLIGYETRALGARVASRLRHRVLLETLGRGGSWPSWLTPPTVRETCMAAQASYRPGALERARVVLVRASRGADGDLPAREVFADPLFGWGRRVSGRLDVIDVDAGHSSMLQGETLRELARRLVPYFDAVPAPSLARENVE